MRKKDKKREKKRRKTGRIMDYRYLFGVRGGRTRRSEGRVAGGWIGRQPRQAPRHCPFVCFVLVSPLFVPSVPYLLSLLFLYYHHFPLFLFFLLFLRCFRCFHWHHYFHPPSFSSHHSWACYSAKLVENFHCL